MLKESKLLPQIACLTILLTSAAAAQTPTYSLEVAAVNSIPVEGSPKGQIAIAPGDWMRVKVFVRDWSPDGESIRAYQAALDPSGFTSGQSGSVKPVDYETTTEKGVENRDHCFIDTTEPRFLHAGLETIPLADSVSLGYRWVSVLLNSEESPVSPQDGTKFYCGTVDLRASDDAEGTFTIGLDEGSNISGLRDPANDPILPLAFEPLTVEVSEAARILRILASDPPDGAIDARRPKRTEGGPTCAWDVIRIEFNGDTVTMAPGNFAIEDGTANPPRIKRLSPDGAVVEMTLDRGINPGSWTTIGHKASRTRIHVGCLPGDVDNDGMVDADDILMLVMQSQTDEVLPDYRRDLDRDGASGVGDVLEMIDLLAGPEVCRKTLRAPL